MSRHLYKLGDIIYGRYKLQQVIGRGAVGIVYLGFDLETHTKLAIKILDPEALANEDVVRRFMRESRLIRKLKSPNTVRFHNTGTTAQNLPFIAMEYLDGKQLSKILKQDGILPPKRAVNILIQLLHSLKEAHDHNIIHRDIKPSNIIILNNNSNNPDNEHLKLLDFGIAAIASDETQLQAANATQSLEIVGTPKYMAPECFQSRQLTNVSDLYSAGCIGYEMLTGINPFEADSLHATMSKHLFDMPTYFPDHLRAYPTLTSTILKMLAKDPKDRFQKAQEIIETLAYWSAPIDYLQAPLNESSTISLQLSQLKLPTAAPQINPRSQTSTTTLTATNTTKFRWRFLQIPKVIWADKQRARQLIEILIVIAAATILSFLISPLIFSK